MDREAPVIARTQGDGHRDGRFGKSRNRQDPLRRDGAGGAAARQTEHGRRLSPPARPDCEVGLPMVGSDLPFAPGDRDERATADEEAPVSRLNGRSRAMCSRGQPPTPWLCRESEWMLGPGRIVDLSGVADAAKERRSPV